MNNYKLIVNDRDNLLMCYEEIYLEKSSVNKINKTFSKLLIL